MGQKTFRCAQISLPHEEMLRLRKSGQLNLGIEDGYAARIASVPGLGPKKTTANAAFHFWNLVIFIGFGYTIYLSVTSDWWWFIIGLIGAGIVWRANKRGNSENYLDAAMIDKDFYERVRAAGGWLYQLDDSTAEKYVKQQQ